MVFHDKYELLALRGGDNEIALPGREIYSARPVLVHLLAGGYAFENQELLRVLGSLSADHRAHVLDTGDHDGIPYVVTDTLPGNLLLRSWVATIVVAPPAAEPAAQAGAPSAEPGEFTRIFRAVGKPPEPEERDTVEMPTPAADSEKPPTQPEIGEFTRLLRTPGSGTNTATAPQVGKAPPTAPAATGKYPEAAQPTVTATAPRSGPAPAEPGEFTRLFRTVDRPPEAPPKPEPVEQRTAEMAIPTAKIENPQHLGEAQVPTAALAQDPGVVTRRLVLAETAAPEAASAPAPAEPGEFTRLFRTIGKPPEGKSTSDTATAAKTQAPSAEPGEFTSMFQSRPPVTPAAGSGPTESTGLFESRAPSRAPQSSGPGEFTRAMKPPLAADSNRSNPAAPAAQPPSEFTRIMQGSALPPPPAVRPVPLPSPQSRESRQAPGEFTRMFEAEPSPAENLSPPVASQVPLPQGGLATGAFSRRSGPTGVAGPSGPSEFTQMISVPSPPPMAVAPKAPKPAAAGVPAMVKTNKSYLPLVLILAGLFLLVLILILIFALTR